MKSKPIWRVKFQFISNKGMQDKMTLNELSEYFGNFLHLENFKGDPSLNGIQIQNSAPDSKQITKVAFATDACEYTARKAVELGAQLLFTHHGLFWGQCEKITGPMYNRLSTFIRNDLALYAAHLPLDANEEVGNNFGLAKRMGLTNIQPFGSWKGMTIGAKGEYETPMPIHEVCLKLFPEGEVPNHILPFGKQEIKTVAIISGSAGDDAEQAVNDNIDTYITGEIQHEDFHKIKELGITVIAGGHYQTETIGVQLVAQKLSSDLNLETVFIDFPTGL